MNSRERLMSFLLILFIGIFITGFLAYQFILSPIQAANGQIADLESKIDEMEQREAKHQRDLKLYEVSRKMSLPADVDLARREYGIQLESLLRKSDFAPNAIKVTPRPIDTKTVPTLALKKPAYTKLLFDIQVTGDLGALVNFLEFFYKQPLLHQVKSMTIQRPTGNSERRRNSTDMEMIIIVEALVLDKAEARATLNPVPSSINMIGGGGGMYAVGQIGVKSGKGSPYHLDPVLATTPRQYAAITGKNIFFGPPPPPPPKREVKIEEPKQVDPDFSPFIKLVGITNDNGKFTATFFDLYNKQDHKITQSTDGSIRVESYYYTGDNKKPVLPRPRHFQFGSEEGGNFRQFKVVKVADSELYLQELNEERDKKIKLGGSLLGGGLVPQLITEKTFMITVGGTVKDAQLLTTREARQILMGSNVPPMTEIKKPGL
jgi:hypothetical protein